MFGKDVRLTSLASRRQLLIAESEVNRAQLSAEWQTMTRGLGDLTLQARTMAACASSAAMLVAGVMAWKHCSGAPPAAKPSWLQKILRAARLASTIWFAFRARAKDAES